MNTVELNSINLQSIDVASNNVSSIGKSIKRNKGIKLLPKEYQQVEYIESTGTQFIDTNLIFKSNTRLSGGFLINSLYDRRQHVFGTYKTGNRYRVSTGTTFDSNTVYYWFGSQAYVNKSINNDKALDVVITKDHVTIFNNKISILDTDLTLDVEFSENNVSITLFGERNPTYGFFIGKFYHFTAFEGETIVRNMIPCYRKSDGEVGMYDTVNDVFYTNQGTGTFIKGPNKNDKTDNKPYIKGHITTSDSTFTFSVDGNNKTVPVDSNGDFKLKVRKSITSLSFVGVPQLESLELFKIDGVTTFDVDYPTDVTFIKCDNTTISAKNDIYHIRGTATDDFDFTLKYIDDNDTVTTVTESAVIDGDGKMGCGV